MISSTATMKPYEISLATGDKAVMCYYERIYRIEGEKEKNYIPTIFNLNGCYFVSALFSDP